jgi:outer membrane biosynthesis protein TonB
MKLLSGKRIGQSGYELLIAVFFSFFIHAAIVAAALFIYSVASPRVSVPPFYNVKLVGLPADIAPTPVRQTATLPPPTPREERKAEPKKTIKTTLKVASTTAKKSAMPEISNQKQKPKTEVIKPSEPAEAQSQKSAAKTEGVSLPTTQEEFKYLWYLNSVKDKIGQNWRPPPDAKDAMARVIFSINRSGWVLGVDIDRDHSNGSTIFIQAAIRAIQSSNPFPPLPEEFGKQSLEFSVDLMAE